ncbi:glycosyltransferase family 4 protein [Rubritalea halochordaticola]
MSAYACEPDKGSEPEVGWKWMSQMAEDHEVIVLTRANNRPVIEAYLDAHPGEASGVRFEYFDLGKRALRLKKRCNLFNWYYILWQYGARNEIKRLVQEQKVDLIHLVTFASFRYPVFLNNADAPVVWGPVGGAELAPWKLLVHRIKLTALFKESVRNVGTYLSSLLVARVDPTINTGGVALASTPGTRAILMSKGIHAELMPTIGVDRLNRPESESKRVSDGAIKFLYVGRLIYMKGVHFLLEALSDPRLSNVQLSIVGDGNERAWLERLAVKLSVDKQVSFVGHVPQHALADIYRQHDVLVVPSMYESGGLTVLEAFAHKLPAIVTEVGGLEMSVDDQCGIRVPVTRGREFVEVLADAMVFYEKNPEMVKCHGERGFLKLIEKYSWKSKKEVMNRCYEQVARSAHGI